jgi:hypothetical protein
MNEQLNRADHNWFVCNKYRINPSIITCTKDYGRWLPGFCMLYYTAACLAGSTSQPSNVAFFAGVSWGKETGSECFCRVPCGIMSAKMLRFSCTLLAEAKFNVA